MATMTEPDCMGPMDPGSSVTLEGIVWHETENGESIIHFQCTVQLSIFTMNKST